MTSPEWVEALGDVAGFCTTFAFVPQLVKIYKQGGRDLSYGMLSLYLFGGEVLRGFSFALVIGILIGTYSSIAVAAPMLVAYQNWRMEKTGVAVVPGAAGRRTKIRA